MARGEFVALWITMICWFRPRPQMATVIDSTDDVDYVYSDETHIQVDGQDAADFRKPDWSPERFRSSMYTCYLSMLRRDVITEVGGFRVGFDGSQDHDLILRVSPK
jgi:hypothetical protein